MQDGNFPKKIRYTYEKSPHLSLNYVHGILGGLTLQGDIELSFYSESDKIPDYSEQVVSSDGELTSEHVQEEEESTRQIVRHIHSKILLNAGTAQALIEWLQANIDRLEEDDNQIQSLFFSPDGNFEQ